MCHFQIGKHNNVLLSNNISSTSPVVGGGGTAGHVTGMELVSSPQNSHKMLQVHHKLKLVSEILSRIIFIQLS